MFPTSDAFLSWANGARLLAGDHLTAADFVGAEAFVLHVYHGTTHAFDTFDPTIRGWSDGQFGAVNYFTTDAWDAHTNYLEDGADLGIRVETMAERLADTLSDDPDAYGLDEDTDFVEAAKHRAREALVGSTPQVLDLLVKCTNPFVLGDNTWKVDALPTWDDWCFDGDPDDEDAWAEASDDAYLERERIIHNALAFAADKLGLSFLDVPTGLMDDTYTGSGDSLEAILKDHFVYLDHPETGDLMNQALIGAFIEGLGYDAIILLHAERRFRTMSMNAGTSHVHLFDTPTHIKASTAIAFNPSDPRFTE